MLLRIRAWLRAAFRRDRLEREMSEEMQRHLELATERYVARGHSPTDARAAARREFGNLGVITEQARAGRGAIWVESLRSDIRYGMRALRRSPAFTGIAVVCLALGIGVNTAAFSVLNAFLLRDLPGVVRQDELATLFLGTEDREGRSSPAYASLPDWETIRTTVPSFSAIAASGNVQLSIRIADDPRAARGELVSGSYFQLLGTHPAMGRFISPDDDIPGAANVVVISAAFWERALASRPDIIGQRLTIGTGIFTVIGVAPAGFVGLSTVEVIDPDFGAPEVFIPLAATPLVRATAGATRSELFDDRWLQVVGRLRPGATVSQAGAEAALGAHQLATAYPRERPGAYAIVRAGPAGSGDAAEMLVGVSFVMLVPILVLLVACANLANQLLVRGVQRANEIAVRLSLGATRGRIVRQLLVETALLSFAASALAVLLARGILDALRAWFLNLPFRIPLDLRVLGFTIALALLSAIVFGLTPALRATRGDLITALKNGTPGGGLGRSRLRNSLVVMQVAASLALITISGTFIGASRRSDASVRDPLEGHLLLASVNLDLLGFDSTAGRGYQARVMERLSALPGVVAVGNSPLVMFESPHDEGIKEVGTDSGRGYTSGKLIEVGGEWFDATNARALRGRLFTRAELSGAPTVAVVDQEFSRQWWSDGDPVGRTLRIGPDSAAHTVTVVGVIPTRAEMVFRRPQGAVFVSGASHYNPSICFYIRTTDRAAALVSSVNQAMHQVDPRVPVFWVRTMEEVAAREGSALSMIASGLGALGSVALALAALGLFGVLSFIVAQRRREIGIRVALGARSIDVTWMVLRQAIVLAVMGVVIGATIAGAVVMLLRSIIYGLDAVNPVGIALTGTMMIAVAIVASLVPARRALRVDAMVALRGD